MSLNLYLGQTPDQPQTRRALRARARDLVARLVRPALAPTTVLLHFAADDAPLDLLIIRPDLLLVGVLHQAEVPVDVQPDGSWLLRERGQTLRGPAGETPLEQIRRGRAAFIRCLERTPPPDLALGSQQLSRTIGAIVLAPTVPAASRIALDIDDHRQQIKLVGLDELPLLAEFTTTGVALNEEAAQAIVESLGGRRWYADEQWLFELARVPFQVRVLGDGAAEALVLPLLEGANVVGRRRAPLKDEYRLTLADDDLMSNSHALIICAADGRVLVRDTSTNGTWVAPPDRAEELLQRAERTIAPGTVLRMGATRVRLEQV